MDCRADELLWQAVTPTKEAEQRIYEFAIGEAVKEITCSEEVRSLLAREVVELPSFPIEDETGVHTMRVPTLEEFLSNSAMHCIKITDDLNIDVMMDTCFMEAKKESSNGQIIEIVMEGDPHSFEREPFM